jgi:hypothetical protein
LCCWWEGTAIISWCCAMGFNTTFFFHQCVCMCENICVYVCVCVCVCERERESGFVCVTLAVRKSGVAVIFVVYNEYWLAGPFHDMSVLGRQIWWLLPWAREVKHRKNRKCF